MHNETLEEELEAEQARFVKSNDHGEHGSWPWPLRRMLFLTVAQMRAVDDHLARTLSFEKV